MRTALSQYYGTQEWMNLLLAVGAAGINEDLVQCYNDVIDERTPGGAHGVSPAPGPRLGARSLAAAQGVSPEDLPPVKGVSHKVIPAHTARHTARQAEQRQGDTEEVKRLWAEADQLSQEAGHPYFDRDGHRVNKELDTKSLVTDLVLA